MAIISPEISSFTPNTSYHSTIRAVGTLKPFASRQMKEELLQRFDHHLNPSESWDNWGRPHVKLHRQVKVIAFNPMDTHLHNLAHQLPRDGLSSLMHRVFSAQARSYNRQTRWRGKVFTPFNAVPFRELADPTQICDMIAYIELNNPISQFETPSTSYQALIGNERRDWFDPSIAVGTFGGMEHYREFMNRRGPAIVRRKLIEWGINPRRHPYRPI